MSSIDSQDNKAFEALAALAQRTQNTDNRFAMEMLELHNRIRAIHRVEALTLSIELCSLAIEWAETLATDNKMRSRPNSVYGENIYYVWTGLPDQEVTANDAVTAWYNEMKKYSFHDKKIQPGCGHFTQMVWKDTKEFGAGHATSKDGTVYIVANYNPPGNIKNKYTHNVLAPEESGHQRHKQDDHN